MTKINNTSKKKKTIFLVISALLLSVLLIVLFVIWSLSTVTKISSDEFRTIIVQEALFNWENARPNNPDHKRLIDKVFFRGNKIKRLTLNISIGDNTTVISGIIDTEGGRVNYESEWDKQVFASFQKEKFSDARDADWVKNANFLFNQDDGTLLQKSYLGVAAQTFKIKTGSKEKVDHYTVSPIKGDVITVDRNFIPLWKKFLISITPFIFLLGGMGLMFFLLYRLQTQGGGGAGGLFGLGKLKNKAEKSNTRFSDVAGIEDEKLELVEIVSYLKNPKKYTEAGARVPKGVLLEGPPGTGKTLLARAVSGEAGVPFFFISGSQFEEVFVGIGAARVRSLFEQAKKQAPAIIFIDEIDAIGKRDSISGKGTGIGGQTLNQILVELDGFEPNLGVVVLAATNFVSGLDSALLRAGRFDRKIQIGLPDLKARMDILKLHARNKKLSPDINFKEFALRTPGFSGAQLEAVLNEAAILMVRHNEQVITREGISEAVDRVIGGPAKKSKRYNDRDKKIVSYHEAGHALAGLKLENAAKVQKVTIIPRGSAGGYTLIAPNEEVKFFSKQHLIDNITSLLAGRASEAVIFGEDNITAGAHDDLSRATELALKIITQLGMSKLGLRDFDSEKRKGFSLEKNYSEETSVEIDHEVDALLNACYEKAKEVILKYKKELKLLAKALFVVETITADDIDYIDKHLKLPPEIAKEEKKQAEIKKQKTTGDFVEIEPD